MSSAAKPRPPSSRPYDRLSKHKTLSNADSLGDLHIISGQGQGGQKKTNDYFENQRHSKPESVWTGHNLQVMGRELKQ